jgi:TIR domain
MKRWDVFISYASEDSESVAVPLVRILRRAGLKVWLDQLQLALGDSLREKIDEGLAASAFGVVILSRDFLAKGWPKRELNGLMAREEDGQKVILPVWHGITKGELTTFSPILADRLAADTAKGIEAVAHDIITAVVSSHTDTPSILVPNTTRLFTMLLEQNADPSRIVEFIALHPKILSAVGTGDLVRGPEIIAGVSVNGLSVPFVVVTLVSTAGIYEICLVDFCAVNGPLLQENGSLASDVEEATSKLQSVLENLETVSEDFWRQLNVHFARIEGKLVPRFTASAVLYARRRAGFTSSEKDYLAEQRKTREPIGIVSYDRLVDAAEHWSAAIEGTLLRRAKSR